MGYLISFGTDGEAMLQLVIAQARAARRMLVDMLYRAAYLACGDAVLDYCLLLCHNHP